MYTSSDAVARVRCPKTDVLLLPGNGVHDGGSWPASWQKVIDRVALLLPVAELRADERADVIDK